MAARRSAFVLSAAIALAQCSGPQRATRTLATQCEIQHTLAGGDTVDGRVDRVEGGWLVTLRLRVHMGAGADAIVIELQGIGQVRRAGAGYACRVTNGAPTDAGAPIFDEELCLDEFDSIADLIDDAEQSARPGETVVQEVSLHPRQRRRSRRSRLAANLQSTQERAEVSRDAQGRIVRVARSSEDGTREEVRVIYPPGTPGHCVRAE